MDNEMVGLEMVRGANVVHPDAKFVVGVMVAVQNRKHLTDSDLKSADVENSIVQDICKLALSYLTDRGAPEVEEAVRSVYRQYRVSSTSAGNSKLFFRLSNQVALAFALIEELAVEAPVDSQTDQARPRLTEDDLDDLDGMDDDRDKDSELKSNRTSKGTGFLKR